MIHERKCDREGAKDAKADAKRISLHSILRALCAFAVVFILTGCEKTIRFATFNASLSRERAGWLLLNLTNPDDPQAKAMADVIQHQNPDVLLLTDVDYDGADRARYLFEQNYLGISQAGAPELRYAYHFTGPVNCGIASGFDLDHDGKVVTTPGTVQYAGDAIGFGMFPGQHGMILLSKFPIDTINVRTFTRFKWKNMPGAQLPTDANGKPWFEPGALNIMRLETTNLWDVPMTIEGKGVHVLINRPTSLASDDPSHRNANRNHDEIRFLADYINDAKYMTDDANGKGGTKPVRFVIMGQRSSPALDQLLKNPNANTAAVSGDPGVIVSKTFKSAKGTILSPAPATQPVAGSDSEQKFVYLDVKF
jgi:3-phytase